MALFLAYEIQLTKIEKKKLIKIEKQKLTDNT